jgi:hypothetical protein
LSKRKKPLKVKGSGGAGGDFGTGGFLLNHMIRLPMDHPDGEPPMTITDETGAILCNFHKALEFMRNEPQVLILLDFASYSSTISGILPERSYIQHNSANSDNKDAAAWVRELRHHRQTEQGKAENDLAKKKYLIADWYTATGFEAPAVIVVTKKSNKEFATMSQRAKAKLVIYKYE